MGKNLQKYDPERLRFIPDLDQEHAVHVTVQLSETPGTVTSIPIPAWAIYLKLYALSGTLYFAVNEDPVVGSVKTSTTLTAADLYVGDYLPSVFLEPRLPSPDAQTLRLAGDTASMQVNVSFTAGPLHIR